MRSPRLAAVCAVLTLFAIRGSVVDPSRSAIAFRLNEHVLAGVPACYFSKWVRRHPANSSIVPGSDVYVTQIGSHYEWYTRLELRHRRVL